MARGVGLFLTALVLMLVGLLMVVQLRGLWGFMGIILMLLPVIIGAGADLSRSGNSN
ncbi:MAG: hypothetical protein K6T63_01190 [Alicyclobacillus herbarius]|uniref:hypothetical protein n=1 Tax=Alicyclobacillus herbarius TaxID=122960 RepID=UPI0003FAC2FF|nr:hypothetical protein [Alicyclobacillus herbarius]MCL6631221.1 hypothetical protein [Alicyclobacillus herbarius]